jgi:flagellar basal-body rod modification protein FlgD
MATEASAIPSNQLRSPLATAAATPQTNSATNSNSASASSTNSGTTMGATDFLSLLTTELKNQDPLNPVDSTQSIAQLAQFSALQATTSMSNNFSAFQSNFAVSQASGLLGDTVTVASTDGNGNASTVSGIVKSVQVIDGAPVFTMTDPKGNAIVGADGTPLTFQPSQITAIAK